MRLNKQQDLILDFFNPTKPVTKPENLKGREEILERGILYLLRGDSVIIQGSRRIGKTSLLHCFNALCSEKNQTCIYISFQSIEKYNSKTFIDYILQKLYSKFKIIQTTEKEDGMLSPLRKLGSVIKKKLNDEELVIILIDEFQVTEELPEIEKRTFYNQFRNVIDEKAIHNELSKFVFLIATSQSVSELSKGISSTLASAFQKTFVLSTISSSSCHQLIQTPFNSIAQIKYELVEFVIQESGGHPYLIKLLLYESIIANYQNIFFEFNSDRFQYLIESQAENIINNLQHSHFMMLLNSLKEFELEIIYQVSNNLEKLSLLDIYKAIFVKNKFVQFSSIRSALEYIENLKILYSINNRFNFSNNLYRRWFNLYFRYYYEESALSHKIEKQQELQAKVQEHTQGEVKALQQDKEQYMNNADKQIRILHLSDIHLGTTAQVQCYFTQLATDLTQNLNVKQLNYLVISGDIANRSTQEEYDAAFELVDKLVKRYGLDPSRIVIVPGNHDLNWELSETAYTFVPKRKLPNPLPEGKYIDAGSAGALICDENEYKKRFDYFSDRFYKKIYSKSYPQEYDQQAIIHPCPEDKILFLGLNSCWEIDHEYKDRAGIHPNAIANALDQILTGKYDGWLKIAVWHHPVNSAESMKNTAFLEQLAVNGFQVGIHGHIHEAKDENFQYDTRRGLRIIAAGTFGAPAKEQVTGIPLQYNLLTLDPDSGVMTVKTRKKEKADGAWSADARWGDKNNPVPRYNINLRYGSGCNIQVDANLNVGNIKPIYGSGVTSKSTKSIESQNFSNFKSKVELTPNIIRELVDILKPFLEEERNRRSLLILALGNDAAVLQQISWGGSVLSFIPDMVCKLVDYGETISGKQALWIFLEYVRSQMGIDKQQQIDRLRPLIDL